MSEANEKSFSLFADNPSPKSSQFSVVFGVAFTVSEMVVLLLIKLEYLPLKMGLFQCPFLIILLVLFL